VVMVGEGLGGTGGAAHGCVRQAAVYHRATIRKGRQARSWDQGANNLGRNARAHPKHTSACGAEMCGVGGPISDASTGRANAL
jgi:hypothetical protein